MKSTADKMKILFMAESVTLAHVARPLYLIQNLNPDQYEIHFATSENYRPLVSSYVENFNAISCQDSVDFQKKLVKGLTVLDKAIIEKQVEEDLVLLEKIKPEVVVGDFRLSLSISARLLKIPYINITNVHWAELNYKNMPVPEIPFFRLIGKTSSEIIFELARNLIVPRVLDRMTKGMNQIRKRYGMNSYDNYFNSYVDSDLAVFADDPTLFPVKSFKNPHIFLGPLNGNLFSVKPIWWDDLKLDRPIIYLNLGSSGNFSSLFELIKELAKVPVQIVVGGIDDERNIETYSTGAKVFKAKFLPGDLLCEVSQVVICNGGSPSTFQALSAGKPVIALTGNMDQVLTMKPLLKMSFIRSHNSWSYSCKDVREEVEYFLSHDIETQKAREYETVLRQNNFKNNFHKALSVVLKKT